MRYFIGSFRFLLIALYILFLIFFAVLVLPVLTDESRAAWIRRLARIVPRIMGVRVKVSGGIPDEDAVTLARRQGKTGYMICSNHISFLDIFLLDSILPVRFVAKKEIESWPVFGLISRAAGTLFIDRSRKRAVLEMAEKMNETLRAGESVLFFPEGTTGEGRVLLPFYANLFASAVATEAELIPVVIRYTQKGKVTTIPSYAGNIPLFTVMKRIVFSSGLEAEVQVLEPISSAGVDRKTLCAQPPPSCPRRSACPTPRRRRKRPSVSAARRRSSTTELSASSRNSEGDRPTWGRTPARSPSCRC